MFEHRPTEPKPDRSNIWAGVIVYLATLALIAWGLWLVFH